MIDPMYVTLGKQLQTASKYGFLDDMEATLEEAKNVDDVVDPLVLEYVYDAQVRDYLVS